jgi:hypothetical protein
MTRNKNSRVRLVDMSQRTTIVVAGIAAYMGHQHAKTLDIEDRNLGIDAAYLVVVDIAIDRTQGFERSDLVSHSQRADIARVPHLIDIAQEIAQRIVEGVVSIRD